MSFYEQIADMFNVDDPQDAARLAITVVAIAIGISLIIYAISILCIAGEAICCLLSLVKCARCCCKSCVDCCTKYCGGSSSSQSGGDEVESSSSSSSPSTKSPPRHNVGQLMSLVVMIFSILVALVWEFYFATEMDSAPATKDAWSENCDDTMSSYPQCLKYQAAYRVAFVATLFFASMTAVTAVQPAFHNQGWDLKIFCYLALLVGLTFAPNRMFDDHGFIWIARVGAFIFLMLQQVILIDSAYCVNEYLVEKGYALQSRPGTVDGEWNMYLVACLLLSAGLVLGALTGLVLLLVYYTGCDTSNTFISFTLLLVVAFTSLQLFATKQAEDGSQGHNLLASAVVAAYVVYLCFVAVSANPVGSCNPTYSQKENVLALVLGLGITFVSITSTVYFASQSFTNLVTGDSAAAAAAPVNNADLESVLTGGATGKDGAVATSRPSLTRQVTGGLDESDGVGGQSWKFNMVMCLISCYWCCVLTDWGNPGGGASAASPTAGHTAMWMNITASWICSLLYLWTIVAPILFPDRDFS